MAFLRDKYHKNGDFDKYKLLRNKSNSEIRKSKKNFFNNAINESEDTITFGKI
jgi:hypothetical protein